MNGGQEPENSIVREVSAFIRAMSARAGSRSLGEAAEALYPGDLSPPQPEELLGHMLHAAAAVLCDTAGERLASEPAPSPAADIGGPAEVVQTAERAIAAIERASLEELSAAHAYFLALPWGHTLVEQPLLAELSRNVTRLMIECAWHCIVERLLLLPTSDAAP